MAESDNRSDKYRMWAAVSFAFMLLIIGIPLWWKTTEVQRAALPYSSIQDLNPSVVVVGMTVFVCSHSPERTNHLITEFEANLKDMDLFNIVYRPLKLRQENATFESIEQTDTYEQRVGEMWLLEVPDLPSDVLLSNKRILYFTPKTESTTLLKVFKDWILQGEKLKSKITSIVSPQSLKDSDDLKALRASLDYNVVFTVINADPEKVNLQWDLAADLKRYFQPLMDQLSEIGVHRLQSQWLYMMGLGQTPKRNSELNVNFLSSAQLPHIITPLEKKLGSGTSKYPCVHMVLYVVNCMVAPLKFATESEEMVTSMTSPQWGAIQLLNPSKDNCENGTELKIDVEEVMGVFISQFHVLLGVSREKSDVDPVKMKGPLLRQWELDNLYRIRTIEQITSASLTLQSLSKLLGEISNIVINEEVAKSITEAVDNVNEAKELLKEVNLVEALRCSLKAYEAAEKAFSDPSLLALLYFPDDQKYAVYIPLFLPIMIPVLMSLKKIQSWMTLSQNSVHFKSD